VKFRSHLKASNLIWLALFSFILINRVPQWVKSYRQQGGQVSGEAIVYRLDGTPMHLPGAEKKALIFWATWCGPCTLELKRVQRMISANSISSEDVIAISLDQEREVVERTVATRGYTFTVAHDPSLGLARLFAVEGTPTVVLINADKSVHWITSGVSPTLEVRLAQFFKSN